MSTATNTPAPAHDAYRPDIDGLRAVAVLSVVAFHAFPTLVPGGFVGVDVFFVISGFLISSILYGGLERGTFSVADFYGRRVRRIFPALLLVLSASLAFGWYALFTDEFGQLAKHVAGGAGFVSNLVLWSESGYFDNEAVTKPLLHLWSLGIEEQFYIVWPLLLWLAWRARVGLGVLVGVLFLVSFGLNLAAVDADRVAAFYSPQTRFWELLAGAGLALAQRRGMLAVPAVVRARDLMAFTGLALVFAGFWLITEEDPFPGVWALLPVAGAVLLIAAGPDARVNRGLLSQPRVVWFGLISFPLYLWHWPLLSFARIIEGGEPAAWLRALAVPVAVLLSWLTWRFVERPLRFGGPLRTKTLALAGLMVVTGVTGYHVARTHVLPLQARDPVLRENLQQFVLDTRPRETTLCRQRLPGYGGTCMTTQAVDDPRPPEFYFVGDSHSRASGTGFLVAYPETRTLVTGKGGCPPLYGVERYNLEKAQLCPPAFAPFFDDLRHDRLRDTTVVISGRYANHVDGRAFMIPGPAGEVHIQPVGPKLPRDAVDYPAVFERGLRETLAMIVPRAKAVVFNYQVPEFAHDPKLCIARPLRTGGGVQCAISRATVDERQRGYRQIVARVLADFPQVIVFDPLEVFCDADYCYAEKDGRMMYRDTHHLGVLGGVAFARAMAGRLPPGLQPRAPSRQQPVP